MITYSRFLRDDEYSARFENEVLPAIAEARHDGTFSGFDGHPLFYSVYTAKKPVGRVVLVHGYTESLEKYRELIYYFLQNGFSVYGFEHRGHGRSWREVENTRLTHVRRFEDYVDDLEIFVDTIVKPGYSGDLFLFCHSMGGGIGALYLEKHPGVFDKAVLSSPMIKAQSMGFPRFLVWTTCTLGCLFGFGKKKHFGVSDDPATHGFVHSSSSFEPRFNQYYQLKMAHPEFQNVAPTYRWGLESLRVTHKILRRGAPEKVATPLILFCAEKDHYVYPGPQLEFIQRVVNGEFILVCDAKHEIYGSPEKVYFPYLKELFEFLENK